MENFDDCEDVVNKLCNDDFGDGDGRESLRILKGIDGFEGGVCGIL